MKKTVYYPLCALMTIAGLALGQQEVYDDEDLLEPKTDTRVTVSAVHHHYVFHHDHLQIRTDDQFVPEDGNHEPWRDGDVNGRGWGLQLGIAQEKGEAIVRFIHSDIDYTLIEPGLSHKIDKDRRDFDVYWQQKSGENKNGIWGWMLGYNYTGENVEINIAEGKDSLRVVDEVKWHMLAAGYWGEALPFDGDIVRFYIQGNALFGEASGLSRQGNDVDIDGDVAETYDSEHSLAYGLNGRIGLKLFLTSRIAASVEYEREWMYSFEATDTGLVVFPDNSDARFINNAYSVFAHIDFIF